MATEIEFFDLEEPREARTGQALTAIGMRISPGVIEAWSANEQLLVHDWAVREKMHAEEPGSVVRRPVPFLLASGAHDAVQRGTIMLAGELDETQAAQVRAWLHEGGETMTTGWLTLKRTGGGRILVRLGRKT